MPSKYWIKLYHEILYDPKMGMMPEILFARCIKLFLLAGDVGKNGRLPAIRDIAWALRITEEEVESDLIELQTLGIVAQTEGVWRINKWSDRQGPMSNSERAKRWRKNQKIRDYREHGPADVEYANGERTISDRKRSEDKEVDTDKEEDREVEVEEHNNFSLVIKAWEQSASPITPGIAEDLGDLADECEAHRIQQPNGAQGSDLEGWEWVIAAIETARRSTTGFNVKYVQKILDRWREDGFQAQYQNASTDARRYKAGDFADFWDA